MPSLQYSLLQHSVTLLRAIAESWGVDLTGLARREAARQLSGVMLAADLAAEVGELPALEQDAIESLAAAGGRMPLEAFARIHGAIRTFGTGRLERERPWDSPGNPAEALWYRGLGFRAFEQTESGSQEFMYLPDELCQALSLPTSHELPLPQVEAVEDVLVVSRQTPSVGMVDDSCTVLAFVQRNLVTAQPDAAVPYDQLSPYLRYKERARLQLIWSLLQEIDLLTTAGEVIRPDSNKARSWLQGSYPHQAAALVQAWLDSERWNDLWHVSEIRPEPTGWSNDPHTPRHLLIEILGVLDRATWWSLPSLLAGVKRTRPDFLRQASEYETWYVRDAATGEYLHGFQNWDRIEGELLRFMVTGPAFWLGLVELGQDRRGELIAFRPTAAGSAFAQVGSWPFPPGPTDVRIRINADATVIVPVAVNRLVRFQVARLTDWEPVAAGGAIYRYRLTPRSLERGRQAGIQLSRALAFLASRSGHPLPDQVKRGIESWEKHGPQVRLRQVTLLQVREPEVLEQLRASPKVRPLLGEAVGPLAVTVRTADWSNLVGAIAELGLLSEVELPRGPMVAD